MGGGRAAHSFLEAGLVDELSLNIIPILLGAGRPLFLPRSSSERLELLETRRYDNGCVSLRYGFADRP